MTSKLAVKAVEGSMVLDIDALKAGVKRFIGYDLVDEVWQINDRTYIVADSAYFRKAIRRGNLILITKTSS